MRIARMMDRIMPVGLISLGLSFSHFAAAQDAATPARTEVIERYEQILERAPVEGPSFDKLLQIYQEGDGLEKLDARWTPLAAQPGAKGATYSLLRGLLADHMNKTDLARQLLQAATQAAPDDFHVWMALGDFETRQGKWVDAIGALQKGLATKVAGDDRLSLYHKLGQAQERNLDLPAALATWQKMVEEFPKDQFALEEAGGSELDAEQFDEAKKTFQKLVDLTEPNSMNRVQALMKLAEVDDRQGKTEAAVHQYEAILPLTAESSWLNRELRAQIEQVYRREDDLAGLVEYYKKWTEANPKDVEAQLLLSGALNELGKKPEALDVLRKVTVLAPDRHEVRETFAQGLVEAKKYDEALTVLTALTADDPTEHRYWETMGDALWLKTQPPTPESKKATLDAWGHIAPPDSKDIAAILQVADLCHDHHLDEEAQAGYQRALAISPDASDIREKAVKLLVDMKRESEAWKLLDGLVDGDRATAGNYLKLATLDRQFDRKDAEADAIQKGLVLEPKNFDLLSMEWTRLAEAQKWSDAVALFDRMIAAAPNAYFIDQIESRHLQALTSSGQLDAVGKGLRAKLGADPGLTESELRLLLRIMIQQSDADIPKALDEAHKRFSQSVSLIRLEIDYNRHLGNYDAAIAALQKLIETVPQQKSDWLGEIVHIRQDQGNMDEALKAAQQIIDASPANASGYLLYAEMALAAGKSDDAVAKLQAAIKISDKPNEVRQRLARYYLEAGQSAKARTTYDEAFAAADNPQDKLTIVRAMATAYFQDGKIEDLINRFKKEQSSEEGGWRYGLYLSAIDEQMEDYGGARRELAKSLAVRPQDAGLLHSLIGLADKDNDRGEVLRYREMLAQADPSPANELALAGEYASQDKAQEAWQIVQKNQAEVVKDPLAWKDVLNQISDPDYAAKIKGVLEAAIRAKGSSFDGNFALVQFQMQQGDLEGAKKTLWDILAAPLPPAPPPQPGTSTNAATANGLAGFWQTPIFQRTTQSYIAQNEAQQLLMSSQGRNQLRQMNMRIYNRMGGMMGVSTTLDPVAIKDHSLVYLSVIALHEKNAENFLKDLQAKIDAWHWTLSERLVAYSLIQAQEPLFQAIEEEGKSASPDKELDQFALIICEQFGAQNNDEATRKRAEAAQKAIAQRLEADPKFKGIVATIELSRLSQDNSPEGLVKKKEALDNFLKTVDRHDPEQLLQAIQMCSQVGNWDEIKKAVDDFAATDRTKWSLTVTQELTYLPLGILSQAAAAQATLPKQPPSNDMVPTMLRLMSLSYPTIPPKPGATNAALIQIYGMGYNQNMFPPPNRYFGPDRVGSLEPLFQQMKARDLLPAFYAGLDQQEKDLNDWRKIYPTLIRVYFQWWSGKRDDAVASVRKLLEQDPSDDFRQLLAAMLSLEQKYDEAIPVLESVSARYGPDYIHTQMQLLHTARLAKNNDVGQKAGLRLIALHLPQQEQYQILDDLREVGLKDKADAIMAKQNNQARGPGNQAMQASIQIQQTLNDAMNKKDDARIAELAHQILNRDPMAPAQFGNENYLRIQALEALKNSQQLDGYIQDIEKQLEAAPDSPRLNWAAAEAYQRMDGHIERTFGLAALPQWLKLQRTGNKIETFYSLDGTNWVASGDTQLDLPQKVYLGFWVSAERAGTQVKATLDQIAFTGKTGVPDAPVPSTPTNPSAGANTNAAPVVATPPAETNALSSTPSTRDVLPAPWQQVDIGTITQAGSAQMNPDGSMVVTGALGGQLPVGGGTHFVYQTLDGDGSLVVRLNKLIGQNEARNATAGIAIREGIDPGSRAADVGLNQTRGVTWRFRDMPTSSTGVRESGSWTMHGTGQFATPLWLKLSRKENTFIGSTSLDGQKWSQVFSQKLTMGPAAQVGLISSLNVQTGPGLATWTDVAVTPAQATSAKAPPAPVPDASAASSATGIAAPVSLPAPWEFIDIGEPTEHGSAQWNNPGFTLTSNVPIMSKDFRSYSYVFQPIQGDGEIVAHLTSQKDVRSHDGLAFRSSLNKASPEIEFYRVNADQVGCYVFANTSDQALHYYQKVAELSPKNQTVLVQVAEQFRLSKRPREAADLYASILKTDFATGMTQYNNVLQAFDEANRLPDFVKIIEDWTPPPLNPMGGMGQDMYFVLMQMGNILKQGGHLPEAERVYRKALTVESYQPKQDCVAALAQVLIDENRRDDAAAEIEKLLLDKDTPAPSSQPILGFNVQFQNRNNWMQSFGWNQNGIISSPIIRFLKLADDLGLSPKLKVEMKAKADKSVMQPGQIEPDRMAYILLLVVSHDPAYRAEVDKLLKDYPSSSMGMGSNPNGFLVLSQELAKWPQERLMALKVAQQVYAGSSGMINNPFFKSIAGLQVIRIAFTVGDHKAAQTTLREIADSMREQRAVNPNMGQIDQSLQIVRWMIQESMFKEAADVLADSKTDPQLANNNTYYQQKIDQAQNELAFAKGDPSSIGLIYGMASLEEKSKGKGSGTGIFWQINAGQKNANTQPYFSNTSWSDQVPLRPTTYKLDVVGGPDEEHLTTHVASYDKVATSGIAPIKIPSGIQVLRASLVTDKPSDKPVSSPAANLPVPPLTSGTSPHPQKPQVQDGASPWTAATAHVLFLKNSENLLKNPTFAATKDASGKASVAGWNGLAVASVTENTGGPLPSHVYSTLEGGNGNGVEISSDRIPLQPGADYIFDGWMRAWVNLSIRYLDEDGKVLNPNQVVYGNNDAEWQWRCWRLNGGPRGAGPSVPIPPKAAFVQIAFRIYQDSDVAGLSLRLGPNSAAAVPAPVPPAPAATTSPSTNVAPLAPPVPKPTLSPVTNAAPVAPKPPPPAPSKPAAPPAPANKPKPTPSTAPQPDLLGAI